MQMTNQPQGSHRMNGHPDGPGGLKAKAVPVGANAPATMIAGDHLVIDANGTTRTFARGSAVSIGRDANNDIVLSNPTVSRRHARITHNGTAWQIEDVGSASGVLVDGVRVSKPALLSGTNVVTIGRRDAGERLVIVSPAGAKLSATQRLRRAGRGKASIAVAALGVVAVAAAGFALTRSSGEGSTASDAGALAKATVHLKAGSATGSGAIVDAKKGLILTSAHVVAPSAPGAGVREKTVESKLTANPVEVSISIAPALDTAAEPRFLGQVVATDGYADLAIVKITKTAGGRRIDDGDLRDLTAVALGDSDKASSGDRVRVLGFPSVAGSNAATLTTGVLSGTVGDDRMNTNRFALNVDAALAPGNSGGVAVDDAGRLIGVPSTVARDTSSTIVAQIGRLRPVNLAKPLIEAARKDEPYQSPAFQPLRGSEAVANLRTVSAASSAGVESACNAAATTVVKGATAIGLSFDFTGFPPGPGFDAAVVITNAAGTAVGSTYADGLRAFTPVDRGCATATVNVSALTAGTYKATVHLGPNYRSVASIDLAIA